MQGKAKDEIGDICTKKYIFSLIKRQFDFSLITNCLLRKTFNLREIFDL